MSSSSNAEKEMREVAEMFGRLVYIMQSLQAELEDVRSRLRAVERLNDVRRVLH